MRTMIPLPTTLLDSPARRALSLSARRLLDRLEVEHVRAGSPAGGVPLTYARLMNDGVDRHAIAPAIREAHALGFIDVIERGAAQSGYGRPNRLAPTYLECEGRKPSNRWARIRTFEEAREIAQAARATEQKAAA